MMRAVTDVLVLEPARSVRGLPRQSLAHLDNPSETFYEIERLVGIEPVLVEHGEHLVNDPFFGL
jgi:hypothetical protein